MLTSMSAPKQRRAALMPNDPSDASGGSGEPVAMDKASRRLSENLGSSLQRLKGSLPFSLSVQTLKRSKTVAVVDCSARRVSPPVPPLGLPTHHALTSPHYPTPTPTPYPPPLSESPTPSQSSNASSEPGSGRTMADVVVPQLLQRGTPMTKVSAKKQKTIVLRLDADEGKITWESKKSGIIRIENIKELRSGVDARYDREQLRLSQEYEDRWLTIVYMLDGRYKSLHIVASTKDVFTVWDHTLRKVYSVRRELMAGIGNTEVRDALWEKQYFKTAGEQEKDHDLRFEDVEKMCRRLNVNSSKEFLQRLFQEADVHKRGYLDFTEFQVFVKLLKRRPELSRLHERLRGKGGIFTFAVFENFMRTSQKSTLSAEELNRTFVKYATPIKDAPAAVVATPTSSPPTDQSPPATATAQTATPAPPPSTEPPPLPLELTLEGFTAFLLSSDNSAFADQSGKVYHDMTRPLSEYYVACSHNTYLVGNQLRGVSTVEGYIRALLHSCRSVELDIYDGDAEPVVYHGKTLTSKVTVREICQAIIKYAFVVSPYPIIISAEIHCSLPQQDVLASIMKETFGTALVCNTLDGKPIDDLDNLPSPEQLKGRILLKAKNLYVSASEGIREKHVIVGAESSSTETSASASESETFQQELRHEFSHEWSKVQKSEPAQELRELKSEFKKAKGAISERMKEIKADVKAVAKGSSSRHNTLPTVTRLVQATSVPAFRDPLPSEIPTPKASQPRVKLSMAIVGLLVYTVGVKCRGLNKKERYANRHMFSLSENTMNKILKQGPKDLIKHTRTHLVRTYPKGSRWDSTNYEPHRFWATGAQLVAINYQTIDLGNMINHAMFQRNGRAGYVLKPSALRSTDKDLLAKRTNHRLDVTIISAQQLPRPKDALGQDIIGPNVADPFVEVSIHTPDWSIPPNPPPTAPAAGSTVSQVEASLALTPSRKVVPQTYRTVSVMNNGFNPVWEEALSIPFEVEGGLSMLDLVFVRFTVRGSEDADSDPLATYCVSLGSLQEGLRHLPLHDFQLSQYLFSTLFVQITVRETA